MLTTETTYDIINLIDLPLALYGSEADYNMIDIRAYEITVFSKVSKRKQFGWLKIYPLIQYKKIKGHLEPSPTSYLLPEDEEVMLALSLISYHQQFARKIRLSSLNEILKVLGKSRGGKNYDRLKESLRRLRGLTIETNLWYNKMYNVYGHKICGILDDVWIVNKNETVRLKNKRNIPGVEITWSEAIWEGLVVGNVRPMNYRRYLQIPASKEGARKLFRIIDKKLFKKSTGGIPFDYLSRKMMGISPVKSDAYCEKLIGSWAQILVDIGYLKAYGFKIWKKKYYFLFRQNIFAEDPPEGRAISLKPQEYPDVI